MIGELEDIGVSIGDKFRKLTVIELKYKLNSRSYFICRCKCGNEKTILESCLLQHCYADCECSESTDDKIKGWEPKDLIGLVFGKLIIIGLGEVLNNKKYLQCKCECGNEEMIEWDKLVNGSKKSCGCSLIHKLPYCEASFNALIFRYKRDAEKRGYKFLLTRDEFKDLISSNCYYCNTPPMQQQKIIGFNGNIEYNGVDRLDNSLDYTVDNVVTCCWDCNHAKKNLSTRCEIT